MTALSEALDRLGKYNLGPYSETDNPLGLTGRGAVDANLEPMLGDVVTVAEATGESATAAAASQAAAAGSALAAAGSAGSAASDAAAAHADRLAADTAVAATAADRTAVATDKTAVHSDRLAADADAVATAADRVAVATDKTAVHADRLAADADAQATAADRLAVAADKTTTAGYRDQAQSAAASAAASAGEARWCGTAAGTANALTLTPASPITALFDGLLIRFRAAQANGPVARANQLRNNAMAGAAVGSPGTAPTNWSGVGTNAGITLAVAATGTTAAGAPYIDVRISGTSSAATSAILIFEGTTQIAAAPGQVWSQNVELALVAGSTSGTGVVLGIREGDSGGSVLNDAVTPNLTLTGTLTRYAQTAMLTNAGTTRA